MTFDTEPAMATARHDLDRYYLPSRIKAKKVPAEGFRCRLALADRIADLPGVHTMENDADTLLSRVHVFFQAPNTSTRKTPSPVLLCTIGREGIVVYGLGEWDKHQVLAGGWGKLEKATCRSSFPEMSRNWRCVGAFCFAPTVTYHMPRPKTRRWTKHCRGNCRDIRERTFSNRSDGNAFVL
jgi:hypothetical protein